MTRAFLWFVLVLAGCFLILGLTQLGTTKPAVLAFWALVAILVSIRLFGKKKGGGGAAA